MWYNATLDDGSSDALEALALEPGSLLQYAVSGDAGEPAQGLAVVRVTAPYRLTKSGRWFDGVHLAAEDSYYAWYMDEKNRGAKGALCKVHGYHLCCCKAEDCRVAGGARYAEVIHIDTARLIDEDSFARFGERCSKAGGVVTAAGDAIASGLDVADASAAPAPAPPPPAQRPMVKGKGRVASRHRAAMHRAAPDNTASEDEALAADVASEAAVEPPAKKARIESRGSGPESVLDRELAGLGGGPAAAAPVRTDLQQRLEELKGRLGLRAAPEAKPSAADILEQRAAEAARARKAEPPVSRPKRARRDTGFDSDDLELEAEDDSDELDGRRGRLLAKRDIFRKVAQRDPGRLTMRGLKEYGQYLASAHGEELNDALPPIMLRYFLTILMPSYKLAVGGEDYRELRTLAECLDLLLKAKPLHTADMLMQRFKSVCSRVRDGPSHAGRWLELLPTELAPTASSLEEDEIVRRLQTGELQLKNLEAKMKLAGHPTHGSG